MFENAKRVAEFEIYHTTAQLRFKINSGSNDDFFGSKCGFNITIRKNHTRKYRILRQVLLYLNSVVRWRSGNAAVCKTAMRRFNSGTHLRFGIITFMANKEQGSSFKEKAWKALEIAAYAVAILGVINWVLL